MPQFRLLTNPRCVDKLANAPIAATRTVVDITVYFSVGYSWNSTGPTRTPTFGMGLSCNFVNVYTIAYCVQYTFTRVHARIPNGHPREDPREEKRACRTSRRTSRRGSSCVSGSWQVERGIRRTRGHPRDNPRAEVGENVRVDVGVDVRVGLMEFQLMAVFAFT